MMMSMAGSAMAIEVARKQLGLVATPKLRGQGCHGLGARHQVGPRGRRCRYLSSEHGGGLREAWQERTGKG